MNAAFLYLRAQDGWFLAKQRKLKMDIQQGCGQEAHAKRLSLLTWAGLGAGERLDPPLGVTFRHIEAWRIAFSAPEEAHTSCLRHQNGLDHKRMPTTSASEVEEICKMFSVFA